MLQMKHEMSCSYILFHIQRRSLFIHKLNHNSSNVFSSSTASGQTGTLQDRIQPASVGGSYLQCL